MNKQEFIRKLAERTGRSQESIVRIAQSILCWRAAFSLLHHHIKKPVN